MVDYRSECLVEKGNCEVVERGWEKVVAFVHKIKFLEVHFQTTDVSQGCLLFWVRLNLLDLGIPMAAAHEIDL